MKTAVFTICAKNYLAQAYTLKESYYKSNKDSNFFIFLSDKKDVEWLSEDIIELNDNWIPNWQQMAFKYNVIEFSTSIKPFCFKKLFEEGYERIIYLDPDIYVTSNLQYIFNLLNEKSIVLSPHYCNIQENYTGSVTEEELLWVGIYNLGFCAIKNDTIGNNIIRWWCNRLSNKCYADHKDGLHVDQKWMDFIPAFYPNNTCITHHMGINPAIWNLHERELIIENNEYKIINVKTKEIYPLLFFHFSGFDPFNKTILNRRHPNYSCDNFPSFIPLIEEYVKAEYKNGYDKYSVLSYSFNSFESDDNIVPLHRRLYRSLEHNMENDINPFSTDSKIYQIIKNNRLLTGIKGNSFRTFTKEQSSNKGKFVKLIIRGLILIKRTVGIKYYIALLNNLKDLIRLENQTFLLKKEDFYHDK